jgi:hypothetical protein
VKASIPISSLLAVLTAVVLLVGGVLTSLRPAAGGWLALAILLAVAAGLSAAMHRRAPKWKPKARDWRRFIAAGMWGNLPLGALAGLLAGALAPLVFRGGATQTGLGTSVYSYETAGIIIGFVLGIGFALLVDARLAAGLLFGYALGFPTALLAASPGAHHLYWTYGGYALIFGGLGVLQLLLKPLLDSAKR